MLEKKKTCNVTKEDKHLGVNTFARHRIQAIL